MISIQGIVVPGHGIASGKSESSPYPKGSIELQIPFFRERGLDLGEYFPGTMNVDISPQQWEPLSADHIFEGVVWTEAHPAENFSFFQCRIEFEAEIYPAWIYYPDPKTKLTHFQNPSILEMISVKIPGIQYGSELRVEIENQKIKLLS